MHDARKYSTEVNVYVLEDLVYCSLLSASVSIGVHCRFQTVKTVFYFVHVYWITTFNWHKLSYRKRQCQKLKYGPREETSKNGKFVQYHCYMFIHIQTCYDSWKACVSCQIWDCWWK